MSIEDSSVHTPVFSLNGHKCKAKVVYVYDGDSVHLVLEVFGKLYKWKCRIAHIDKLKTLIEHKMVDVECFDFDKYGRLLVEITIEGIKVHEWLLENHLAQPYEGGTKTAWTDF